MYTQKDLYRLFEQCAGVCTDSRNVGADSLFFALHGASFDGNRFAADALNAGARYAVVDSDEPLLAHPEAAERMVRVEDTLATLQSLAREHRERLALPIIGIVGSNGKTTTKELVSRVLAERFRVYATRGNLNNHIGVPLTLLAMTRATEFGVVEMGASACGEIASLCRIAEPDYGIITNIGRSHLEGFGGVEGIRRGKGELFDYLAKHGGRAFVPQEDAVLTAMAAEREGMAVESYSRHIADGVESQLSGDYNYYNIAAAVAVGRYFDIADEQIRSAIGSYAPDNNRSQEMLSGRGNRLIIDCYNANPSSMQAAIANLASHAGDRKVLILGDMLELGQWSASEHRHVLEQALQIAGAELLLIGSDFAQAYASLPHSSHECHTFGTTAEAADFLQRTPLRGATVLLKGSHRWALENLITLL